MTISGVLIVSPQTLWFPGHCFQSVPVACGVVHRTETSRELWDVLKGEHRVGLFHQNQGNCSNVFLGKLRRVVSFPFFPPDELRFGVIPLHPKKKLLFFQPKCFRFQQNVKQKFVSKCQQHGRLDA